jgi:hypothetical protein
MKLVGEKNLVNSSLEKHKDFKILLKYTRRTREMLKKVCFIHSTTC